MRFKEKIEYKNKNGKIVRIEDTMFGGTKYKLFDNKGNYVKELKVPFKVSDCL